MPKPEPEAFPVTEDDYEFIAKEKRDKPEKRRAYLSTHFWRVQLPSQFRDK